MSQNVLILLHANTEAHDEANRAPKTILRLTYEAIVQVPPAVVLSKISLERNCTKKANTHLSSNLISKISRFLKFASFRPRRIHSKVITVSRRMDWWNNPPPRIKKQRVFFVIRETFECLFLPSWNMTCSTTRRQRREASPRHSRYSRSLDVPIPRLSDRHSPGHCCLLIS